VIFIGLQQKSGNFNGFASSVDIDFGLPDIGERHNEAWNP
jgi:hypothetical protein